MSGYSTFKIKFRTRYNEITNEKACKNPLYSHKLLSCPFLISLIWYLVKLTTRQAFCNVSGGLFSDWTNHASGYNRPYPEIDDVSVNVSRGKSLEISLIAYMKANPEAAHLVLPELSARLYEVFETADDSDMGESVQRYRQQVSIPMAIALDYISSSNDIQTTLDAIAESLTEPATVSSDTMYSASPRKPISDYHAVFSAAMRINALVLSKNTPIGDARINTLIDNVVREMSYSGDKTALHEEIKKLAGRLRGVHEALIPRMLRNPQKRWMVKAFSGLPAIQVIMKMRKWSSMPKFITRVMN